MAGGARGREAEARRNDRAVLDAARLVFAVHGPDAPVSAVAAEAGVGMGSLYRRYPSKEVLLQDLCLESMRQLEAAGEQAAEEDDAWEALTGFVRECVSFRAGAFATVAGSVATTQEMTETAQRGHDVVVRLVARAHAQGTLRADVNGVDMHLLIELFSRRRADDGAHQRLLAIALDGLSVAAPRSALPGAAPTWSDYATRWRPS